MESQIKYIQEALQPLLAKSLEGNKEASEQMEGIITDVITSMMDDPLIKPLLF